MYLKARKFGLTLLQYANFLSKCENKLNIELHHPDYVVMSRERYEKLIEIINKRKIKIYFDEFKDI